MIQSLRFRLAAGALVAIIVVLAAAGTILSRVFTDYVEERYRGEMSAVIDQISSAVEMRDGHLVLTQEPPDPRFGPPASGRYWQVTLDNGTVRRSESLWDTALDTAGRSQTHGFGQGEGPDGSALLVLTRQLSLLKDGKPLSFTASAAFSRQEFDASLQAYHSTLIRMLALTAVLLTLAAFLQGAIGLMPLKRLRRAVAEVRQGRLARIAESGPREVRPLLAELNLLLQERETAVERARARASDLAHGLKTPLTVLLQLCDSLPPAERALARQQVELVRQRADRQLQAARLGVEQMVSTDLATLAGKLVMVLGPVMRTRGIECIVTLSPELSVKADPADLAECLGNVLDNAAKWAKSRIQIGARVLESGMIEIGIADDGPGVGNTDHDLILSRGGRIDGEGSEGSGLGLAISMDIVKAYGGTLALARGPLGGLDVRISLPGGQA